MLIFSTIADLLLAPVQIAIYSLFVVSLFETGRMLVQWPLRAIGRNALRDLPTQYREHGLSESFVCIFPNPSLRLEDLEVAAMRRLEFIRIATRVTPMLGLIATLIPMGPALLALTKTTWRR